MGILIIPALFSLLQKKAWTNPYRVVLLLWICVPVILFYFPNVGFGTGGLRLFQTYQHLPLAILAASSLIPLLEKRRLLGFILAIGMSVVSIVYAAPTYYDHLLYYSGLNHQYFATYSVFTRAQPLYNYLNKETPKEAVIVTDEFVGMILPAVTHNRVILGHDGDNIDYYRKKADIEKFYAGLIPREDLQKFLNQYRVNYILYGINTPPFEFSSYKDVLYFEEVFKANDFTLIKVNRDKF